MFPLFITDASLRFVGRVKTEFFAAGFELQGGDLLQVCECTLLVLWMRFIAAEDAFCESLQMKRFNCGNNTVW